MTAFFLAVSLAIVVSFVCSISEAALLSITHAQIQTLGETRPGLILRRFKREIDIPISAILILNTIANTIGALVAGAKFEEVFGDSYLLGFTIVFTAAILIFSEIIPKTVGAVHTTRFIVPVTYFVAVLSFVLRPLIFFTRLLVKLIRGKRAPVTSLEEIRLLAELGASEGALAKRTARMIEGASRLKELTAYDVMVPRTDVVFLSGNKSIRHNLDIVRHSGISRFPYSREGQADRIDGIVMTRDFLLALYEPTPPPEPGDTSPPPSLRVTDDSATVFLDRISRETEFVTESSALEELLRRFQETRQHMVIVVDEYGGTEGIVTLEDVLEEIVGEIQDESDRVDPFVIRRPDGKLFCRGRAETRKVFDVLDLEREVESVTLGGLMAEELGRLPVVDDVVEIEGHRFEVIRATVRSVERVLVTPAPDRSNEN